MSPSALRSILRALLSADACSMSPDGNPVLQCFELVLDLISESVDAWRTRQYDYYQRVLNGIL